MYSIDIYQRFREACFLHLQGLSCHFDALRMGEIVGRLIYFMYFMHIYHILQCF
jgi:hypothetical protein